MKRIRLLVAAFCALLLPIFVSAEAPVVGPNTFSFTAASQSNVWTCNGGQSSFALTVPPGLTGVLTVTVAQTMNGTYSEPPWAYVPGTPVYTNTLTNSGSLTVNLGSNGYVKVADTTYTSGSVTVTGVCSSAVAVIPPQVTSLAAGSNIVISTPSPAQPMVSVTAAPSFTSLSLTTPLTIANGGTGSATQNFVDLSSAQTIAGIKTFSSAPLSANGYDAGSSTYGPTSASVNGALTATQFNGSGAGLTAATVPNAALVTTPVTSVGASGPIASSGGTTPSISCATCVTSVTASAPIASSGGTTPALTLTGLVPIANGGNGTATPLLAATSPLAVTGVWPAQSFACATCVTSVTASAPIASSGGTTPALTLGVVPIADGGTGSATQNFVDLTSAQTIVGVKTFSSAPLSANGYGAGSSTYGPTGATILGTVSMGAGASQMQVDVVNPGQTRLIPASSTLPFDFMNAANTVSNLVINDNGTINLYGGLTTGPMGVNGANMIVDETAGNGVSLSGNSIAVTGCGAATCRTGLDIPLCYQNSTVSTSASCPTQDVSTTISGGVLTQLVAYCTGEDNGTTVFTLYTVNTSTNAQTSVATMTLGNAVYRTTAAISVALSPPEALYGNVTTAGTASNCSFSVDGTQNVQ